MKSSPRHHRHHRRQYHTAVLTLTLVSIWLPLPVRAFTRSARLPVGDDVSYSRPSASTPRNIFTVPGFATRHSNDFTIGAVPLGVVEGDLLSWDEFNRLSRIDATIDALRNQLPLTLTKPLTAASAQPMFEPNVKLTVLVAGSGGNTEQDTDEIELLKSLDELIALSDVLVLGTATAQQASLVFGGGSNSNNPNNDPAVSCQIILDPSCQSLLVPWKAKVPSFFPGTSGFLTPNTTPNARTSTTSTSTTSTPGLDTLEGLSEFHFNSKDGTIERHCIRSVVWNGQSVNGPSIGQALRALQSAMANIQNSPLVRLVGGINSNSNSNSNRNQNNKDTTNTNGNWMDVLRDGLLEQAATVASSRRSSTASSSSGSSNSQQQAKPAVIPVTSTSNITGWIQQQQSNNEEYSNNQTAPRISSLPNTTAIPLPGTDEWKAYAQAHDAIVEFCEQVIPVLSTTEKVVSQYFAKNATLISTQGSKLLQGQEAMANFFQGLSLTRRSTGGSWKMQRSVVLDWKKRTIAVDYTATNNPWTITGQDVYTLVAPPPTTTTMDDDAADGDDTESSSCIPLIQEIRQTELSVTTPDGSVTLDGPWLMKNLASAVERSSTSTTTSTAMIGPNLRDLFSEILLQQQPLQAKNNAIMGQPKRSATTTSTTNIKKPKVSQIAAANTFYFMSELQNSIPNLWNTTSTSRNPLPPAAEYLDESVELRGYLGEPLLRGSNVYNRAVGSLLATTRQSLVQKRLMLDTTKTSPPPVRVELTPKGNVRLSMVLAFRVPPPGGGALFPDTAPAVPLTLDIVSDYVLDPQTGRVVQHKLVETRVNGQLTPGDVLSRSLQRFWNLESDDAAAGSRRNSNDDLLQSVSEAISWLRSFSSNSSS